MERKHSLSTLPSIFAGMMLLLCVPGMTENESVKAWLDTETVQRGRPFHIMIQARGESIESPSLPEVDGLLISSTPRIRQDSWNISMNTREHTMIRGYRAHASRTGSITIPPIAVTIGGKTYHTEPLQIEVTDSAPPPRPRPEDLSPEKRLRPEAQEPARGPVSADDIVLLEASVDQSEVYLNEPVMLTLTFLEFVDAHTRIRGLEEVMPTTEGFYVFPLQREGPRGQTPLEFRNGRRYRVEERIRVLYPTATGELTISPWRYYGIASIGLGFQQTRHELAVETDPITITVNPLPEGPPSFTGAVGQFEVSASLSEREVVQGVPVILTLRITGQGNPNAIGRLRLDGVEGYTVAVPATDVRNIRSPDAPRFAKEFTYAITPYQTGDLTIPAFDFAYFDPSRADYVIETLGPFSLAVRSSANQEPRVFVDSGMGSPTPAIETFATGLLPPVAITGTLRPRSLSATLATPMALTLPVVAYGAIALMLARRRRLRTDRRYARAVRARSRADKQLRAMHAASDPAAALYRALTGYVADLLNIDNAGLTPGEVEQALRDEEAEQWLIDNFMRILRSCERARYAATPLSEEELNAMSHGAQLSMEALHQHLRQRERV